MRKNVRALSTPAGKERLPGTPVSRARRFFPFGYAQGQNDNQKSKSKYKGKAHSKGNSKGNSNSKGKGKNAGISPLSVRKSANAPVEMTMPEVQGNQSR